MDELSKVLGIDVEKAYTHGRFSDMQRVVEKIENMKYLIQIWIIHDLIKDFVMIKSLQ